jgi:ketol-acid reductoisomerase
MHRYVSDTAKYGDLTRGPRVVNEATRKEMRRILKEIQTGKFARQWIGETQSGAKNYRRLLKRDLHHPIERVGARLRERMPWLKDTR